MNINKELIDINDGKTFPVQFPSQEMLKNAKEVTKGKKGEPDTSILKPELLPRETVGTVIMTCLPRYIATEKNDGFYVKNIYNLIKDLQAKPRDVELNVKTKKALERVLDQATRMIVNKTYFNDKGEKQEGEKSIGTYPAWVIAQVKEEAGLIPDDIEDSPVAPIEPEQPLKEVKK